MLTLYKAYMREKYPRVLANDMITLCAEVSQD